MAVWTSSSPGAKTKAPVANSSSTMSSVSTSVVTSLSLRMPALPRPLTCAREPTRSSPASTRSKGRLTVNAATASAMPVEMRPSQSVNAPPSPLLPPPAPAPGSPSAAPGPWRADHVATPRPHRRTNPSASACRKRVGRIVGRQVVVVERDRAAPAHHGAGARRGEAQPHLPRHVALALGDEGLQRASAGASTTARRRRARPSVARGAPSRGACPAPASGPPGRRGP